MDINLNLTKEFDMRGFSDYSFYPNRTMCDVLDAMLKMHKRYSFGELPGMVEELRYMAQRLETVIEDRRDVDKFKIMRSELKSDLKKLQAEVKQAKREKDLLLGGTGEK